MQKIELSFKPFTHHHEQRSSGEMPWLHKAEYAGLIASAIGSIAAGLSMQIAYAAAPLTLTLALNLANRQRFERQTKTSQQDTVAAIAQVDRWMRSEVDAVRLSIQTLPPSEQVRDIEASMLRLSTLWGQLQQRLADWSPATEDPKIQQEFAIVRRAVVRLRDSTDANISTVRQSLEQEIALLRQQLNQAIAADRDTNGEAAASDRGSLVNQTAFEIAPLQTQIDQIHQRVNELEQKNRELIGPYLKRLVKDVKQQQASTAHMETTLDQLSQGIGELIWQINSLAQESDSHLDSQHIQILHSAVERLSENLPARSRLVEIEPQPVRSVDYP